jgi:hypothetical protein
MYDLAWFAKLDCFKNVKDKQCSLFCCFICEEEKSLKMDKCQCFFLLLCLILKQVLKYVP